MEDDLLTAADVADYLGTSERTLRRWRLEGTGPKFLRVGRFIRYRRSAVVAWLEAQERDRDD